MAGEPGFEPGLTESESVGLPLTYSPCDDEVRIDAHGADVNVTPASLRRDRSKVAVSRVAAWERPETADRSDIDRPPIGQPARAAARSLEDETVVVAIRRRALPPLVDRLHALRRSIPQAPLSSALRVNPRGMVDADRPNARPNAGGDRPAYPDISTPVSVGRRADTHPQPVSRLTLAFAGGAENAVRRGCGSGSTHRFEQSSAGRLPPAYEADAD